MAVRGRERVLGALMYWRMYRMSFRRRSGTEVKTPRAMTSRSIRSMPLAGSEASLLLGAFRIKGAGRRFSTARCGSVLILLPMLAVNITKSN